MPIVTSGFQFVTEDVNFILAGGCMQTFEPITVECDDDGAITHISWDRGRATLAADDGDPFKRRLFETMSEAIALQCSDTIQDHVAETAERTRERADERRAELAMGK